MDDWTDVDNTIAEINSFISCSTFASRRAKLHFTLLGLIDRKAVTQQIQALKRDVYQPTFERVLFEVGDYALEVYLEKVQAKVQAQELDYRTICRRENFEFIKDEDSEHKIKLKDKAKLTIRVSKHLNKLGQIWRIQLHSDLEQEVAEIMVAWTFSRIEDAQGLDAIESMSLAQLKKLFNQYFNQHQIKYQLQGWYNNQFTELTRKKLEEIGLEKLSIEELEYLLGFQSDLQLYRRLRQTLQDFGFTLSEKIQNLDKAVALFQRTRSANSNVKCISV